MNPVDASNRADGAWGSVRLPAILGSDGRAVVATRGSLTGGSAAKTVSLPKTQLGQASYTLDVRVVSAVNPGRVLQLSSPPLSRT